MSRKDTKAIKSIHKMYRQLNLDQEEVVHKTKMLLSVYRDVVWATMRGADELRAEFIYYGEGLNAALIYLEEFAPDTKRQEFEHRICGLFENQWMVDLIDKAMSKIYEYHNNGRVYHEILSKCYLTVFRYTESELLDLLNMERSVFYDRKKEAILLLGIAIWGYAIPFFRGMCAVDEGADKTGGYS